MQDYAAGMRTQVRQAVTDGVAIGRSEVGWALAAMCSFVESCRIAGETDAPARYLDDSEVRTMALAAVTRLLASSYYAALAESSQRATIQETGVMVYLLTAGRI